MFSVCMSYTQISIQDSGLFGPNPWNILAPPSNYLSKKGFWATQPLRQILDSEFLLCELGMCFRYRSVIFVLRSGWMSERRADRGSEGLPTNPRAPLGAPPRMPPSPRPTPNEADFRCLRGICCGSPTMFKHTNAILYQIPPPPRRRTRASGEMRAILSHEAQPAAMERARVARGASAALCMYICMYIYIYIYIKERERERERDR